MNEQINHFLTLCLRSLNDPLMQPRLLELSRQPDFDWEQVYQAAVAARLAPLLYQAMRRQEILPVSLKGKLRQAYEFHAVRNTLLLHELSNVQSQLMAKNVSAIPLKGAALAETLYKNLALRPMRDIDLLLKPKDIPRALQILAKQGYEQSDPEAHSGITFGFENEILLCKPGSVRVLLELHWSLIDSPYYQERLDMDWFWETAVSTTINKQPAQSLSSEARILYLCAHMVLHHSDQDLLWLNDIYEVIRQSEASLKWHVVLEKAQEYDLLLPLQAVLPKLALEWGSPVPQSMLRELSGKEPSAVEQKVHGWLTAVNRPVAQRFWSDLATIPHWRQRLHFARQHIFPAPAYLQQRYAIPYAFLTPIYYPYRWLTGLYSILLSLFSTQ